MTAGQPTLIEQHTVVGELAACDLLELGEKVGNGKRLLLFSCNVKDDMALMHHDEAIAQADSIVHVVRDHKGREVILLDDFLGKGKDLSSGFGVKRRRMLVEREHLRLLRVAMSRVSAWR